MLVQIMPASGFDRDHSVLLESQVQAQAAVAAPVINSVVDEVQSLLPQLRHHCVSIPFAAGWMGIFEPGGTNGEFAHVVHMVWCCRTDSPLGRDT